MEKLTNESYLSYIKRITHSCANKNITYSEWGDYVLGAENVYSEDNCRKGFYIVSKLIDKIDENTIDEGSAFKELEIAKEQIRKERIKLQTANVERTRMDRVESRQQMYYEFVGNIKDTLPVPEFQPTYRNESSVEYLACLADIHFGANFKSANNEYSIEICKDRFNVLLYDLIDFVQKKKIHKINILELGDTLQGVLRVSDLKLNETSIVKATVMISKIIAKFLTDLSEYCYIDYYHVPFANHTQTRNLGTKASELADEDIEYVISHYIEDLCSNNERIKVHLANEGSQWLDINLNGNSIVAMHGHTIKSIDTSIRDLSILKRDFIDYLIIGHFHGNKELTSSEGCCNDTEVIVCPSFVGSDPYSDSLMRGSKSSVKVYGFDDLYGHTETYKFVLN